MQLFFAGLPTLTGKMPFVQKKVAGYGKGAFHLWHNRLNRAVFLPEISATGAALLWIIAVFHFEVRHETNRHKKRTWLKT